MRPSTIGVGPPGEHRARSNLFAALEAAMPVEFRPVESSWDGLDGLVRFVDPDGDPNPPPVGLPLFEVVPTDGIETGPVIDLSEAAPPALAGRSISEPGIRFGSLRARSGETVVASTGGAPVWLRGEGPLHRVSAFADDLPPATSIRCRLGPGSWFGLVPLIQFLREVVGLEDFALPRRRAAFLIDDPNLHTGRYGHLAFQPVVEHATRFGHHLAVAMIPLDAFHAGHRAVSLFARHSDRISLLIHGNDHRRHELESFADAGRRVAMLAQALRRMETFERRTGLAVDRVMAPPHEAASREVVVDMARLGYEGITMTRTEPWAGPWPGVGSLAGWFPGHIGPGAPVISRFPLGAPVEEVALHDFLGQPLVMYGHHESLRGGLDILETYAGGFGRVEWVSLGAIARSNFGTKVRGSALLVRPYSTTIDVDVPADVDSLEVHLPPTIAWDAEVAVVISSAESGDVRVPVDGRVAETVTVAPSTPLRVRLDRDDALDHRSVSEPPPSPRSLGRRLLTEARDRVSSAVHRMSRP